MFVMRNDKFRDPKFCNDLIEATTFDGKRYYIEMAKYVDVERDLVYLFNGRTREVVPTYSTLKKASREYLRNAIEAMSKRACSESCGSADIRRG